MRAIYECIKNKFLTLSYDTFFPTLSPGYDDIGNFSGYTIIPSYKSLQFMQGKVELTDPKEIKAMRKYIKSRRDEFIKEIFFEGNEVELEEPIVEEVVQEEPKKALVGLQYDDMTEQDKAIYNNMMRKR